MVAQLKIVGGTAPNGTPMVAKAHRIAKDVESLLEQLEELRATGHQPMQCRVAVAQAIETNDLDAAAAIHDRLQEKLAELRRPPLSDLTLDVVFHRVLTITFSFVFVFGFINIIIGRHYFDYSFLTRFWR